jgi:hypothetical protein
LYIWRRAINALFIIPGTIFDGRSAASRCSRRTMTRAEHLSQAYPGFGTVGAGGWGGLTGGDCARAAGQQYLISSVLLSILSLLLLFKSLVWAGGFLVV